MADERPLADDAVPWQVERKRRLFTYPAETSWRSPGDIYESTAPADVDDYTGEHGAIPEQVTRRVQIDPAEFAVVHFEIEFNPNPRPAQYDYSFACGQTDVRDWDDWEYLPLWYCKHDARCCTLQRWSVRV